MKNSQKELLQFPAPLEQPENSTITVHIGGDHFAIHYQIEDLPPSAPVLRMQKTKQRAAKIATFPDLPIRAHRGTIVRMKRVDRKQRAD
jgi:hypothetical protein